MEAEVGVMRMLTVMQYLAGADSVDLHICPGLDDDNDDPYWTEVVCDSNQAQVGRTLLNPLSSPLKHTAWLILVLAWSFLAIGLVIANFILKAL